jgi:hypothetical protein
MIVEQKDKGSVATKMLVVMKLITKIFPLVRGIKYEYQKTGVRKEGLNAPV